MAGRLRPREESGGRSEPARRPGPGPRRRRADTHRRAATAPDERQNPLGSTVYLGTATSGLAQTVSPPPVGR